MTLKYNISNDVLFSGEFRINDQSNLTYRVYLTVLIQVSNAIREAPHYAAFSIDVPKQFLLLLPP